MIFKVEELEPNVHLIRGYRKEDDIKVCFSCVLHKPKDEKKWHLHIARSDVGSFKEAKKVLQYLENYPDGVFTYVSDDDWERFYKKYDFRKVDF
jgi:hypothetical protein